MPPSRWPIPCRARSTSLPRHSARSSPMPRCAPSRVACGLGFSRKAVTPPAQDESCLQGRPVPRTISSSGASPPCPRAAWSALAGAPRSRELIDPASCEPSGRSEEHTSELQSPYDLVCRLLLEKKNLTKSDKLQQSQKARDLLTFFSNNKNVPLRKKLHSSLRSNLSNRRTVSIEFTLLTTPRSI